jgi:hypothetical protein
LCRILHLQTRRRRSKTLPCSITHH